MQGIQPVTPSLGSMTRTGMLLKTPYAPEGQTGDRSLAEPADNLQPAADRQPAHDCQPAESTPAAFGM